MKFLLITCIMILVLVAGGVYAFLYLGLVSFRADQSPSAFEQKYAMKALDASTKHYAADIENPIQMTDANLLEGMKLYQAKCAGCHGDPGNPQFGVASPFYPPAPRFLKDPPDLPGSQNFYIIKHGIRWTGMPAWGNRLSDDQIWKLTAFLSQMGKLPPAVDQEWKKGKNAAGSGGGN
jgi:mono/diheme cytochrome c family protein